MRIVYEIYQQCRYIDLSWKQKIIDEMKIINILILVLLFFTTTSEACKCIPYTFEKGIELSDNIFVGKVIKCV
jgi:hypothetical protein